VKIQAALHGATINKGESKPGEDDSIIFKDPKEYEKLSPEERKTLTQKMMGKIAGSKFPGMGGPKKKGEK
jgi:hypothetical protein